MAWAPATARAAWRCSSGSPRRSRAAAARHKGELIFTFVADEENLGPDGMEFLRKSGRVRPDALILGAQTENNLIVAERGVMWARLTTKGKAAHAGNPSAGDNAILRMMRLVGALQAHYDKALAKRVTRAP